MKTQLMQYLNQPNVYKMVWKNVTRANRITPNVEHKLTSKLTGYQLSNKVSIMCARTIDKVARAIDCIWAHCLPANTAPLQFPKYTATSSL